jgi:ketosteroid isomerase-like protein
MSHPNEDLIRRLYKAFASQDMAVIDQLLADDITWHAPGRARNAGIRRGKAALFAVMGELAQLTGGTMSSDVHDVLANDDRAVVLQTTKASREGRPALKDREVLVFEVRKGKVTEVTEYPGDLYAMDAFFE